ncbi:MAG: AAA family ATPase [Xanthomonadaceae bacterium]|nr:AAA family ATPase [Xanthomonadaceae bacterium]
MVQTIQLLRNIGQFDSVNAGAQIPFAKLTVVYGENGRGKTTLSAVLRSLASGTPGPISDRHRLGAAHPPHVVLGFAAGQPAVFQNGAWSRVEPNVMVFDDEFVAQNVCTGIEVIPGNRQNLHELIVGSQGVVLNAAVQTHVDRIEQHNRDLRAKADAIPAARRGGLDADAFCALEHIANLAKQIDDAEKRLAAARSSAAIADAAVFPVLSLPIFDLAALDALLTRDLPGLEEAAAERVRAHIAVLGDGGERWVSEGLAHADHVARDGAASCPFCAQNLAGSPVIDHYRAYFGAAYNGLKRDVADAIRSLDNTHAGDVPAAFERRVREAVERREFWQPFAELPAVAIDTAEIARAWKTAREGVLERLQAKQAAPLEALAVDEALRGAVAAYDGHRAALDRVTAELAQANDALAIVKEEARAANVPALTADLSRLRAVESRHEPAIAALCVAYTDERDAKGQTETARDNARDALNQYRQNVFPAYQNAVNDYLRRFNAGFRLGGVAPVNNRGGSAANYNVLINDIAVGLTAAEGPSFRTALSAGDRNTLALAFFFATLERGPGLANKIVVIDDPMTSLDEHRTLHTVQEIHRLVGTAEQVIVLSHSKPFILTVWEKCSALPRAALQVVRAQQGSTLAAWDVTGDMVTLHDKRHADALAYLQAADPAVERRIAESLRPMLEAFVRVAYPAQFKPGGKLGQFADICRQRLGGADEVMGPIDTGELRALLDFANRYHHDENPAYQTEAINDRELTDFTRRTLALASRPRN